MFEICGVRFSRERWSLVSKFGRPARVCLGPSGWDVYELTERGGEVHANTFYTSKMHNVSLRSLLDGAGYRAFA